MATLIAPTTIPATDCIGNSLVTINNNFSTLFTDIQNLQKTLPFTASLKQNGYQLLPSGLILQWGITPAKSQKDSPFTVTFSIPFPNVCLNITATAVNTDKNLGNNGDKYPQVYGTPTPTNFSLIAQAVNNSKVAYPIYWFAIGF